MKESHDVLGMVKFATSRSRSKYVIGEKAGRFW